jgi:hypothetical protein
MVLKAFLRRRLLTWLRVCQRSYVVRGGLRRVEAGSGGFRGQLWKLVLGVVIVLVEDVV